jgi:hypothetical protein
MKRPSEKFLKDMSIDELSSESKWHAREASKLLDEVRDLREHALELNELGAVDALRSAMTKEEEAEAHMHQSNLLDSLHAARLSEQGVGEVVHAAKA